MPVSRALGEELGLSVVVPTSLEEARAAVAAARLVIGSRMHACLNALSTGTPAIPLAYSRKFEPLMEDIGWPYVLDLRQSDSVLEPLLEAVSSIDASAASEVRALRERAEQKLEISVAALRGVAR